MHRALVSFVFAAALAVPRALGAEPVRPQQPPLDVTADHLDLDVETKSASMSGHVKITKGTLELRCPRVDVRYDDASHVTWVRGSGGVVAEVGPQKVRAEAPEIELDAATQTLLLKGGVRVTRGEGWITADRATVQIATGKVSMTDVHGSLPVGSADKGLPTIDPSAHR